MNKRILFVDDETNVLDGLKRMLHIRRQEWDMFFAKSGEEALKLLDSDPFNVVVTDIRMPGMDGCELLGKIKQRYPDLVRIILSGQSDRDIFIKSFGLAHQFLSKPCDANILTTTIEGACSLRNVLKDETLRRLVSRITVLPSLPMHYVELMEELRSPKASVDHVGKIISKDMGMTARILQLANSALFALREHVSDPAHAASLLGLETIKAFVLSIQVFQQFDQEALKTLSIQTLWLHSITVGAFSQAIARTENRGEQFVHDAIMAGLLHDVGKLVLASQFPNEWQKLVTLVQESKMNPCDAERNMFGATHAELGAYLLGLWGMSYPIVEALAYHHTPGQCYIQDFSLVTAVHVANVLEPEIHPSDEQWPPDQMDIEYLERIECAGRLPIWREACRMLKKDLQQWKTKSLS